MLVVFRVGVDSRPNPSALAHSPTFFRVPAAPRPSLLHIAPHPGAAEGGLASLFLHCDICKSFHFSLRHMYTVFTLGKPGGMKFATVSTRTIFFLSDSFHREPIPDCYTFHT